MFSLGPWPKFTSYMSQFSFLTFKSVINQFCVQPILESSKSMSNQVSNLLSGREWGGKDEQVHKR